MQCVRDLPLLTVWRTPRLLCTEQGINLEATGRKPREQKCVVSKDPEMLCLFPHEP